MANESRDAFVIESVRRVAVLTQWVQLPVDTAEDHRISRNRPRKPRRCVPSEAHCSREGWRVSAAPSDTRSRIRPLRKVFGRRDTCCRCGQSVSSIRVGSPYRARPFCFGRDAPIPRMQSLPQILAGRRSKVEQISVSADSVREWKLDPSNPEDAAKGEPDSPSPPSTNRNTAHDGERRPTRSPTWRPHERSIESALRSRRPRWPGSRPIVWAIGENSGTPCPRRGAGRPNQNRAKSTVPPRNARRMAGGNGSVPNSF